MKRLTAWLTGLAGGIAAYRLFKREADPVVAAPDPAEALKAKLAETKAVAEPEASQDVDGRRRSVHEQARAAIDDMNADA